MNSNLNKTSAALGGVYDAGDPIARNFSYKNTLNPFASMWNGNIRVPEWWAQLWGVSEAGKRGAVISANAIASAGLIALAVAGARGATWLARMSKLRESDDASVDMAKQLGTTYSSTAADVDDKEIKKASADSSYIVDRNKLGNTGAIVLAAAIPIVGFGAGMTSYRIANKLFDGLRNDYISGAVADKSKQVSNMMRVRALLARNKITPDEARKAVAAINDGEDYIKKASSDVDTVKAGFADYVADWAHKGYNLIRPSAEKSEGLATGVSAASLLLLALFGSSVLGSYYYFKSNNQRNRRFDAFSKGLKEYARSKASTAPIAMTDVESKMYADLDDEDKKDVARNEPEYDFGAVSKPVSITL